MGRMGFVEFLYMPLSTAITSRNRTTKRSMWTLDVELEWVDGLCLSPVFVGSLIERYKCVLILIAPHGLIGHDCRDCWTF